MVGIIGEYNPFHNGHIYHINEVKKMFPNKIIVLVLAGHFLNRGEVSVINKWDKTMLALKYGVDLVVELPFMFASQAADIYAYGAVQILDKLKCEYLVFGSESNDINLLIENSKKIEEIEENNLSKQGFNYPASIAKIANIEISTPNDLLGISYIKAINKLSSNIKPMTIKRTNDYHDLNLKNKITSASSIRNAIKEKKNIKKYVPTTKYIKNISLDNFFPLIKHQILIDDLSKYQGVDKKLENALKKNVMLCHCLEDLIQSVNTKNYTYNYIKRALCHILVGFKKEEFSDTISYIRILGFNEKGKKYLREIKKDIDIPIYTNYNKDLELELKVSKIYSLLLGNDIINQEIMNKPIMK